MTIHFNYLPQPELVDILAERDFLLNIVKTYPQGGVITHHSIVKMEQMELMPKQTPNERAEYTQVLTSFLQALEQRSIEKLARTVRHEQAYEMVQSSSKQSEPCAPIKLVF